MLARIEEYQLTPAKPFQGGAVEHRPGHLGFDMHQAFELGVLLSGYEERHLEDVVNLVKPGDMWLCAAWEPHGWLPQEPGTRELVLQFLPEFIGEEVFDGLSWLILFAMPAEHRSLVGTKERREEILAIAHELHREMVERQQGWLDFVRLGILRLLLLFKRDRQSVAQVGRTYALRQGNLEKIMPAVRLVHSDPTQRLSVARAAASCGLSVSQFARLFRTLMGLSFSKFCARSRLAYVAHLLLTTHLPVEAIADTAGFANASHLHHAFVRVYRVTPARYRTSGQNGRGGPSSSEIETLLADNYPEVDAS